MSKQSTLNNIPFQARLTVNPHFQQTGMGPDIIRRAAEQALIIHIDDELNKWRDEFKGFDAPHNYRSIITIEIHPSYFDLHNPTSLAHSQTLPTLVTEWIRYFDKVFRTEGSSFGEVLEKQLGMYPLTVYYFGNHGKLCFTFPMTGGEKMINAPWLQMVEVMVKLENNDHKVLEWLNSVRRQKNDMSFLMFEPGKHSWQLIDRLVDAAARLSTYYLESIKDDRIRKPYIAFNEDNYNEYIYIDNQWSLDLDKETIILPQPNDIALYVRLTDKAINAAEPFYKEEHALRSGKQHMPLLFSGDYLKYYDFFEHIIAAITFSYCSVESFANICIPSGFEYTEHGKDNKKKVYDKHAIERSMPLRDKLKFVLREVLKTPDVTDEKWWPHFTYLERIRNEIIHTKQSKSEERYASFLAKRVFEAIRCNKTIIKFYGPYIQKEYPVLLFDFPYGFGHDTVPPALMKNEDFVES